MPNQTNTDALLDQEFDNILDDFGHAVVNNQEVSYSRITLKIAPKKRLRQLFEAELARREAEARKDGFDIGFKAAGGDVIPLKYAEPVQKLTKAVEGVEQ